MENKKTFKEFVKENKAKVIVGAVVTVVTGVLIGLASKVLRDNETDMIEVNYSDDEDEQQSEIESVEE